MASRWTSSLNGTEAAALSIGMVTLVDIDYVGGHVYAHDGGGSLIFGGNTYQGVGRYGRIEAVFESIDVVARGVKLKLSGVDAAHLSDATTGGSQGRAVTIYIALLNKATFAFIDTPEVVWAGKIDNHEIELEAGLGVITLNCENRLRREPRIARYTNEDQQLAYAGDTFFDLLYQIPGFRSQWGSVIISYSGTGGRGRDSNPRPTPLP